MPILVIVLGIIIVVLGAVVFFVPNDTTPTETPLVTEDAKLPEQMEETTPDVAVSEPTPEPTKEIETPVTANSYTADVTYLTPARTSHAMSVSLTIENGIVTDSTIAYDGKSDGFSNPSQEKFDSLYKTEVIGKSLSDISLSRVGGASLTSQAFNDAVAQIAAQQS